VNISVENISQVDKKITIEADQTDLGPRIDSALKKYRKQINVPGFRPGKAPMGLVKKRIGKEVENEQVDEFIQEVFQKDILPEHKPVGEPKMESMDYTDGKLKVELLIGTSPEFELTDLSEIEADKLVHDVTDEEVQKEFDHKVNSVREYTTSEEPATENAKVTIDTVRLDADDNETDDTDSDVVIDLKSEQTPEVYRDQLKGKKAGESLTITIDEDGEQVAYKTEVKQVEEPGDAELNEDTFKELSRGAATSEEEFRSFLKSQIQDYFDRTSDDLVKDKIVNALIDAHDFEIPKNVLEDILKSRIEGIRQENNDELPADFDKEAFEKENQENILKEGKWTFIVSKLFEKYPETELQAEDIDKFFEAESAKMGLPADMLKQFYASQSGQLEQLRMRIRTDKLFAKLQDEVKLNELSRKEYEKKYSPESDKKAEKEEANS